MAAIAFKLTWLHRLLAAPGGITRPWDFRRRHRSASIPDGTTPGGRRYRCKEIGSYAKAQALVRQGTVTSMAMAMEKCVNCCDKSTRSINKRRS